MQTLGGKKRDPAYARGDVDPEYNRRFEVNPKFYGRIRPGRKTNEFLPSSLPVFDEYFQMK